MSATLPPIASRLEAVIRDVYQLGTAPLNWHADFEEDLRGDSLDHVELIVAVEQAFGLDILDEDALRWHTPQQVLNHLVQVVR